MTHGMGTEHGKEGGEPRDTPEPHPHMAVQG